MRCFACLQRQNSAAANPTTAAAANSTPATEQKYDDPRIPLNTREKFALSKNWKGISREAMRTGTNMFIKMFEDNEQFYDMFEKFKRVKLKEMTKEEQLDCEELQKMEEPFLHAVKLTLDERYTENMERIYKTVIHVILTAMEQEARQEKQRSNS